MAGFFEAITSIAKNLATPEGLTTLAIGGIQAAGVLQRGQESQENLQERANVARDRAALNRETAEAVRRSSVERAVIMRERAERFIAGQTSAFITGNIRTNVGVPLLAEAETRADIAKEISFDLETGRVEAGQLISSAGEEEKLASRFEKIGKARKKRSKLEAIGVIAGRSLAFLDV